MAEAEDKSASLIDIVLDETSFVRRNAEIEHEKAVAIFDLLEKNHFRLLADDNGHAVTGPYKLVLSLADDRVVYAISDEDGHPLRTFPLPVRPFRSIIKDYFMVCESYFEAIKTKTPSQIEAIDMGRRGLHNEGAQLLKERLAEAVEIDENTARRLFTLLCVLHMRG